ncbi:hypothetical protein, partial [Saccharomonospora iraqiensis]|uniref:hypothetical protein n=1 Tax=Saccharomonospora iraqiensis TaxID=52698 RepID=UPI00022DF4C2
MSRNEAAVLEHGPAPSEPDVFVAPTSAQVEWVRRVLLRDRGPGRGARLLHAACYPGDEGCGADRETAAVRALR